MITGGVSAIMGVRVDIRGDGEVGGTKFFYDGPTTSGSKLCSSVSEPVWSYMVFIR